MRNLNGVCDSGFLENQADVERKFFSENGRQLENISESLRIITASALVNRGFSSRVVALSANTRARVILSEFSRGYILNNPESATISAGSLEGTALASATRAVAGNTQSMSLSVGNYLDCHLLLNVSAVSGGASLDIYAQSRDPVSLNWADTQLVFSGITGIGTYYAFIEKLGIATRLALRWTISTGTITFSIGHVLKDVLAGGTTGGTSTIFIGGSGVSTATGFPLVGGEYLSLCFRENAELWAITESDVELRIFELSGTAIRGITGR